MSNSLAIVRDAQRRGRLIGHLIDVNGHIAYPSMDALNESKGIIPVVDDLLRVDRDILVSMAPEQFRKQAKKRLVFALPLGTRRERAQHRSRKSLNLTHCLNPQWSKSILANCHAIPKLGFGPWISTAFPQAPALGDVFSESFASMGPGVCGVSPFISVRVRKRGKVLGRMTQGIVE